MATAVQEPPPPAAPPAAPAADAPAEPVTPAPTAPVAAAPATGGIQRGSRWAQVKAWLRLAYTDLGSKEHHILLEWIIWMVIVSIVMTVLQHDAALEERYHTQLRVLDAFVFVVFAADYALNMYFAPSKRGYALSFSGIVDFLSILPSALIFVDTSTVKVLRALRFLRFLRILQVVKAVQHRQAISGEDEENQSLLLDLQLSVIGVSALLLLVPDDALRNMLLGCTLVAALSIGMRRWLVYKQRPTVSILVLVISIIAAMFYAIGLDTAGQSDWAVWFLVGTVLIALITWFQIEAPAGI